MPRHREPEPHAFRTRRGLVGHASQAIKEEGERGRGNTASLVAHGELHFVVPSREPDEYAAALVRELDRVRQEIRQHLFDPVRVALSGRHHGLTSDARQRFERGIDPALLPDAIEAATRMILDLCGGEPSDVTAAGAEPAWQRNATLRFARVAALGGLNVAPDDAVDSLVRLGFAVVSRDAASVTANQPVDVNGVTFSFPDDNNPAAFNDVLGTP